MIDALLEDKQGLSIGRLIDPICIMYLGLVLHDRITLLDLLSFGLSSYCTVYCGSLYVSGTFAVAALWIHVGHLWIFPRALAAIWIHSSALDP